MLNALFFYRVARWLFVHHVPVLPKLTTLLIFLVYNSKVPYQAKIGKGTKLGYGGIGVVIHKKSVIGNNCIIGQHVTVGGVILIIQVSLLLEIMYTLVMGQLFLEELL